MSENARIAELLDRLRHNPCGKDMADLADICLSDATTESDRDAIRGTASRSRELMFALERWSFSTGEADPERRLLLRLAAISMSDGWPDPRDAFTTARELVRDAYAQGERYIAQVQKIIAISTPRVQHVLTSPVLNMTLWCAPRPSPGDRR